MFLPMSWTSPFTVAIRILPLATGAVPDFEFLGLDEGQEIADRLLHHAGALHHLRQEHLSRAEQIADDIHAVHQRAFDHVERLFRLQPRFRCRRR